MLHNILAQFGEARAFIVWKYVQFPNEPKPRKCPWGYNDRHQLGEVSALDPRQWMPPLMAADTVELRGADGIGVALTTDLAVCMIDLDNALQADGTWSDFALSVLARFPGAAVEISPSGRGLHIFFRYLAAVVEPHRTRTKGLPGLEVYTRDRFATLTGNGLIGDLNVDHTGALLQLIADYLPEKIGDKSDEWTDTPYDGWRGGGTDEQIINFLLNRRQSAAVAFGSAAPFAALWNADADILPQFFPPDSHKWPWNRSSADQALANHLSWATGFDCERTRQLMRASGLMRDKYDREDYLYNTILKAVGNKRREAEAKARGSLPPLPPDVNLPSIVAPVHNQTSEVMTLTGAPVTLPPLPAGALSAEQPIQLPSPSPLPPLPPGVLAPGADPAQSAESSPALTEYKAETGDAPYNPDAGKYLLIPEMERLFHNCVYVQDLNKIITPDGAMVDQNTFNNIHGGRQFQLTMDGKATKNAWEGYISNEVKRFPRVACTFFDPREQPHAIVERNGVLQYNSWSPVHVEMIEGDVTPFTNHLLKLWPYGVDAKLFEYYMAAAMQFKGVKFHWWPLLQGVEGNGKTFFSLVMKHCLGPRYVYFAKAKDIDNNFNSFLVGKLMLCFEDVYLTESKNSAWETLKPIITSEDQEIEFKGVDKTNREICANGLMNTNHRNALRKTPNDRRIGAFFGAQQTVSDLRRDGLDSAYFKRLYDWAEKEGGYSKIAHHLMHLDIPYHMNPATGLKRAPTTTSTEAMIVASRGSVEQEVIEAIDSGRDGFRGGWISSLALDHLLAEMGKTRQMPRAQRVDMLLALGYEPHPALPNGRVIQTLPDNTRPILFLKPEHPAFKLTPMEATQMYITDQRPIK